MHYSTTFKMQSPMLMTCCSLSGVANMRLKLWQRAKTLMAEHHAMCKNCKNCERRHQTALINHTHMSVNSSGSMNVYFYSLLLKQFINHYQSRQSRVNYSTVKQPYCIHVHLKKCHHIQNKHINTMYIRSIYVCDVLPVAHPMASRTTLNVPTNEQ